MENIDPWAIPDFCRIPQAARNASWAGVKLTKPKVPKGRKHDWRLPKTMDATAWRILKEEEAEKERRKKERLEMLKALKQTRKP